MTGTEYETKPNNYKPPTEVELGTSLWAGVPENATKVALTDGRASGWKIPK